MKDQGAPRRGRRRGCVACFFRVFTQEIRIMSRVITVLLWLAAIGCGVIGGLYFAFSTFIMTALDRAGAVTGTVAMNSINVVILQSLFMPLFWATTLACLVLAVLGGFQWRESSG